MPSSRGRDYAGNDAIKSLRLRGSDWLSGETVRKAVEPALVVGISVGFVQASESKAELMKPNIPYISIEGTQGESAVAIAKALLNLAQKVYE
jgi:hypothetical protein